MIDLRKRTIALFFNCLIVVLLLSACGSDPVQTPGAEMIPTKAEPAARVAFSAGTQGNFEIYIMNEDGSGKIQVTDHPANDTNPVWSNDGKKIAFVSDRDGDQKIYVMNADGSDQVMLVPGSGIEYAADWSPDDRKITFTSFQDGNSDIYVINADGTNLIRLTQDSASDVGSRWSPDGSRIIYSSEVGGPYEGNYEIIAINADGSATVNLTNNPARDYCPVWSPDGRMIAFNSDRTGMDAIYTMNADGSEPVLLVTTEGYVSCTDWSQDGKKLIFNLQANGRSDIFVMNPDGSNIISISDGTAYDYDPNWSPGVTSPLVARAATPTVEPMVNPTATSMAAVPTTPIGKPREISIAYVTDPNDTFPGVETVKAFQQVVDGFLGGRNITATWVNIEPDAEALRGLQSDPQAFDIVIVAMGKPSEEVSFILRAWLQGGGILWVFDNGGVSTWRNKVLMGGLLPGADLDWEPPEEVQIMVEGLGVYPYDDRGFLAQGIEGSIFVAGYPTIMFDPESNSYYSNLTRFDRQLDDSTIPLLKAQQVGEAVIGGAEPQPGEWIIVGVGKRTGKGLVVVMPFLGLIDPPSPQFQANLIEWCLDQVGK